MAWRYVKSIDSKLQNMFMFMEKLSEKLFSLIQLFRFTHQRFGLYPSNSTFEGLETQVITPNRAFFIESGKWIFTFTFIIIQLNNWEISSLDKVKLDLCWTWEIVWNKTDHSLRSKGKLQTGLFLCCCRKYDKPRRKAHSGIIFGRFIWFQVLRHTQYHLGHNRWFSEWDSVWDLALRASFFQRQCWVETDRSPCFLLHPVTLTLYLPGSSTFPWAIVNTLFCWFDCWPYLTKLSKTHTMPGRLCMSV